MGDRISEIVEGDFNFCGCGMPDKFLQYIRDILRRANEEPPARFFYKDTDDFWKDEGQGLAVLYMLNEKGFIEHGVGILGSWTTDKGKALLVKLEEIKLDD